jgi:hypothetical protein
MRTDVTPIPFDCTPPEWRSAVRWVALLAGLFPDLTIDVAEEDIPDRPPVIPGER